MCSSSATIRTSVRSRESAPCCGSKSAAATLATVNDPLTELSERLEEAAEQLRAPDVEVDSALALIEECARLASEASSRVDEQTRAALEPLPDLPGQLPLPAA